MKLPMERENDKQNVSGVMKRKGKSAPSCSAKNCPSSECDDDGISFFPFPAKQTRCKQWLLNADLQNLMQKNMQRLSNSYQLCSRHFEDGQFSDNTKTALTEDAIPTIFDTLPSPNAASSSQPSHSKQEVTNLEIKLEEVGANQTIESTQPPVEDDTGPIHATGLFRNTANRDRENMFHCQWCSAINCSNSRLKNPDLSFFRFPVDPERCKKWVMNSQRFDLKDKYNSLHGGNYTLCSEHFETKCIIVNNARRRLFGWAVPTIFNFSISAKSKSNRKKPAPTFPSQSVKGKPGRRTRSFQRGRRPAVQAEPQECETKRLPTLKELREENLSLSSTLHQLSGTRIDTMRRLGELETKMNALKEHAGIDVDLIGQALDASKKQEGQLQLEKLRSMIQLLTDGDEGSENEDNASCDNLE